MKTRCAFAAGHPLTVAAGAEVLAAGGSAVDAVVAGAAMAMVAEPVLAGPYGGGFLMLAEGGRVRCLDAFVDTPARRRPDGETDLRTITADFGTSTQRFHIGAASIAVSGLMAALARAQGDAGRMPLGDLVQPAVRAAREGVVITAFQARLGRVVAPILTASPASSALNTDADGAPLAEGARRRNPDLGDVLEVFGIEGPDLLVRGEVAQALAAQAAEGGHLVLDDLARWRPVYRTPLRASRAGVRLSLTPPPAIGGALTALPLALMPPSAGTPARLARAFALTLMARGASGIDADAATGAARLAETGLQGALAGALAGPAGGWWAAARAAAARGRATRGTTHLSAIDRTGAAASLTLSNGEGCGLIVPGTGIMANNMLGEEDLVPPGPDGEPGDWPPGQRLASMMTPAIMDWPDGRRAALGSGGSARIRTAMAQVMLRLVDGTAPGRLPDLGAAIEAPRLHVDTAEDGAAVDLDYERDGLAEEAERALLDDWPRDVGAVRPWETRSMFYGGVHAVTAGPDGSAAAAGDPRRGGDAWTG